MVDGIIVSGEWETDWAFRWRRCPSLLLLPLSAQTINTHTCYSSWWNLLLMSAHSLQLYSSSAVPGESRKMWNFFPLIWSNSRSRTRDLVISRWRDILAKHLVGFGLNLDYSWSFRDRLGDRGFMNSCSLDLGWLYQVIRSLTFCMLNGVKRPASQISKSKRTK